MAQVGAGHQPRPVGDLQGVLDFQVVAGFLGVQPGAAAERLGAAGLQGGVAVLDARVGAGGGQGLADVAVVGQVQVAQLLGEKQPAAGPLGAGERVAEAQVQVVVFVGVLAVGAHLELVARGKLALPVEAEEGALAHLVGVVVVVGQFLKAGFRRPVQPRAAAAGVHGEGVARRQLEHGAAVELVDALGVAVFQRCDAGVVAVVALAADADAEGAVFELVAGAQARVADAVVAGTHADPLADTVAGVAGDDVDHPGESVGAVGGGGRATGDFDAFHVFQADRQIVPADPGEAGLVNAAPVDQHQHAAGVAGLGAVVGNGGHVAVGLGHRHARHQTQHLVQLPGAADADQFAVDDSNAGGHFGNGLVQARRGQHPGHLALIIERRVRPGGQRQPWQKRQY